MIRHPGQPENAYTASQLAKAGCGVDTTIRRRYAKVSEDRLTTIIVNNNKTICFPFDLLTEQDQLKVSMYEAIHDRENTAQRIKILDELLTIPQQPAQSTLPAAGSVPAAAGATLSAVATPKQLTVPDAKSLSGKQDRTATARYSLMKMIEKRPSYRKVTPYIRELAQKIKDGADEKLVALAQAANDRKGATREGVSFDSLMRWWTKHLACGGQANAMAPKIKGKKWERTTITDWLQEYQPGSAAVALLPTGIPDWFPWFLDAYRRPQKPSLHYALKIICRVMPPQIERPSYDQIRRICKKTPDILLEKGRMTGAEYNSMLGYVERDASGFMPMSICQIDGHSFKAYVAHPTTGAHFHPEICGVICLSTKMIVGWSAGLAESHRTVGDAYKHACLINDNKRYGGIPAILEPDLGSGNKAKLNSDNFTGLFARMGTTVKFPERAGNPQGHGAIERSNQSVWIAAAKNLPTYTGKDMDRGAQRKVYIQLERDLKKIKDEGKLSMVPKTSKLLLSWTEFLEFLELAVADYNNTPHRALPKIVAPQPFNPDGPAVSRNMTPCEYWDSFVEEGFKPRQIAIDDLFTLEKLCQPHETVTVKRERFTLFGNTYWAAELKHYYNQTVIVSYDIHDPHRVMVLDTDESYICHAKWNSNRRHARPVSQVDQATMDRHDRRAKLAERKLDMIHAEAEQQAIEVIPTHIELEPQVIAYQAQEAAKELERANAPKLPSTIQELYEDIREREIRGEASSYEIQWAEDRSASLYLGSNKKVGLFKEDPYCHGRFTAENMQFPIEKAAGAGHTNGF